MEKYVGVYAYVWLKSLWSDAATALRCKFCWYTIVGIVLKQSYATSWKKLTFSLVIAFIRGRKVEVAASASEVVRVPGLVQSSNTVLHEKSGYIITREQMPNSVNHDSITQ